MSAEDFEFSLQRLKDTGRSTTGEIYLPGLTLVSMEDTGRDLNHDGDLTDPGEKKVWGRTRIPCGRYEIKLRNEGKLNEKWKQIFPFHRGMLWLQDVLGFEYIYIHPLNTAKESHGCIGSGLEKVNADYIRGSRISYAKLTAFIHDAFDNGCKVFIEIFDEPKEI